MKKLALAIASLAIAAAPVFACPHEDKAENENDAKTAEKQKEKSQDTAKKEATPKTAKTTKPAEKKTDKVSQK